jgi:hypothetical protein
MMSAVVAKSHCLRVDFAGNRMFGRQPWSSIGKRATSVLQAELDIYLRDIIRLLGSADDDFTPEA